MFFRAILTGVCLAVACFSQTAPPAKPATQPATFGEMVREARSRIKEIGVEEWKDLAAGNEKYTLIDVREDNEWAAGHAAGALHVGRGVLERDVQGKVPQKDARIVVYCGGGFRSALAADTLQNMGYTRVASLTGGFAAYQKLGLPVEK
jgi:rhodanese-related sulfurtransferase